MLKVAYPDRGNRLAQWRSKGLDPYHRSKLMFLLGQRRFLPRVLNYALYRLERARVSKVHYFPPALSIETNGSCNLGCPGCVTGLMLPAGTRKKKAALATLKKVIDEASRRCFQINFHRQGEPLLSDKFYPASA